ncbi:P-loop ATPase, Sll1717 family [Amycolatopsis sp. NPDC098790]|uniref:P-loop ATPase, Sll1717 family n=1 Tax=Amycolatopsis sp. NPDC098790 TaxID=3363939 RepID=UPI003804B581
MPEGTVGRLHFGRDDAEHDFADGLLREGFLVTKAFEEASAGHKNLVIGRKGTGKSAICVRMAANGGACVITPDETAGEELRRFELQGLTGATAKSLIWRYVFAVQAARHLIAHARTGHRRRFSKPVRALRRFLEKSGELADVSFYDRILRGGQGLQASLSLEAFGVKASVDHKSGGTEGARAAKQLEVLEAGVARAFQALGCASHAPLPVLVDQLEQVWSSDRESDDLVIGLLLASKRVNQAYGGAVRCVLFVRSDIYDALQFDDADKFHSDELRLEWTPEKLEEVALLRARASLGRPLSSRQLWSEVFPERVSDEPAAQYLFSRTLPRPRDAIQFLNLCRDAANARGADRVTEADVRGATLQFSQWKLLDLAKEYLVTVPFLDRLFVLFQNTGYVVMRSAVATRLEPFAEVLHGQFPNYATILTADGVVEVLYRVGFLGVLRESGVSYAGSGQLPLQPQENEFHIHPCFRPALNALDAAPLLPFEASTRLVQISADRVTNASFAVTGSGLRVSQSRDFELLDRLVEVCQRLLRQVSRMPLPAGVHEQVTGEISAVLSNTATARDRLFAGYAEINAFGHVVQAAQYLDELAERLMKAGIGARDDGIVQTLVASSRQLHDEMGGGYSPTRS